MSMLYCGKKNEIFKIRNDDPYLVKIINQADFESAHREGKKVGSTFARRHEDGRRVIVLRHRPIIN